VLAQSEGVRQSVVVARPDALGNQRLVAYVVVEGELNQRAVLAHLKTKLPEYMVPALLVKLPEIPLTANGKVDKKALPEPDVIQLNSNVYQAPRNETEAKLVTLWQGLLGVEQVGVEDNFFELGGDSIITIQLVSRARGAGLSFQPKDVFQHQTIAQLAAHLQVPVASATEQGMLSGEAGLLPIQQWFFDQDYTQPAHFNQSLLLAVNKRLSPTLLQQALPALVIQHDALRLRYTCQDGRWRQYYSEEAAAQLDLVDLTACSANELLAEITRVGEHYQQSLRLDEGSLYRFVWIETPSFESRNRLLLIAHHLLVDGVSWRILLEDLETCLQALDEGKTIALGTKTSSIRQWHQTLVRYAEQTAIHQQAYWQQIAQTAFALPVDDGVEVARLTGEQTISVTLDAVFTQALLTSAHLAYHTQINDLLLTALAQTISEWSGREEVVIGLEGHGREELGADTDLTRTVGWLTNLYPLRLLVESVASADLIQSVKEQLREIPDRGLGYGALRYLHPDVKVRQSLQGPPFEIVFNYLGQLDNAFLGSLWLEAAKESAGSAVSDYNRTSTKLEINASTTGGRLSVAFRYSGNSTTRRPLRPLRGST
jgi:non-ribosomal peptide synthase protein (TIGR01720 family)